jgi:hypothetical protein
LPYRFLRRPEGNKLESKLAWEGKRILVVKSERSCEGKSTVHRVGSQDRGPFGRAPTLEARMKKKKRMQGTVEKIIRPVDPRHPEKAQISVHEADDLYREIRIENVVTDDNGKKASLKPQAQVEVIIEAESSATNEWSPS